MYALCSRSDLRPIKELTRKELRTIADSDWNLWCRDCRAVRKILWETKRRRTLYLKDIPHLCCLNFQWLLVPFHARFLLGCLTAFSNNKSERRSRGIHASSTIQRRLVKLVFQWHEDGATLLYTSVCHLEIAGPGGETRDDFLIDETLPKDVASAFDEDAWLGEYDEDFLIMDEETVLVALGVEIVVKPWLMPPETWDVDTLDETLVARTVDLLAGRMILEVETLELRSIDVEMAEARAFEVSRLLDSAYEP